MTSRRGEFRVVMGPWPDTKFPSAAERGRPGTLGSVRPSAHSETRAISRLRRQARKPWEL
jgi:hypothetical protein